MGFLFLGAAALVALLLSTGSKDKPSSTVGPAGTPGGTPQSDTGLSPALQETIAKVLRDLGVNDDGTLTCVATSGQAVQAATTLAAQLDSMGANVAAQQLRDYAKRAAACIPTPTAAQSMPLPASIPKELQDKINRALLLEGDPKVLRSISASLRSITPQTTQIAMAAKTLDAKATQIESAMSTAAALTQAQQVLTTSPGIPQIPMSPTPSQVNVPPVATPQALPETLPPNAQLAKATALMLSRTQSSTKTIALSKGKEDQAMVKRFQAAEGLTADGKAGPKTMLAMAKYVDILPFVMWWPAGSSTAAVKTYRAALLAMNGLGRQLHITAAAERGQAMGLSVP